MIADVQDRGNKQIAHKGGEDPVADVSADIGGWKQNEDDAADRNNADVAHSGIVVE